MVIKSRGKLIKPIIYCKAMILYESSIRRYPIFGVIKYGRVYVENYI